MNLKIKTGSIVDLVTYLMEHEDDIAYSVNDFGDLRALFVDVMGEDPKKERLTDK